MTQANELLDIRKGQRIEMTGDRKGTVLDVFPEKGRSLSGKRHRPRVLVQLDNKPSMAIKIAAGQVIGRG